jgi:hypothetical protein
VRRTSMRWRVRLPACTLSRVSSATLAGVRAGLVDVRAQSCE